MKHGLITKAFKLEGDTKGESRNRVLSDSELKTLLDEIRDNQFNLFVRFAYYTGARSGEIRSISRENIFSNHIVAYGKSGKRLIKLNNQAQEIISNLMSSGITKGTSYHTSSRKKPEGLVSLISGSTTLGEPLVII